MIQCPKEWGGVGQREEWKEPDQGDTGREDNKGITRKTAVDGRQGSKGPDRLVIKTYICYMLLVLPTAAARSNVLLRCLFYI